MAWVIGIGILLVLGLVYPAFGKSALKVAGGLLLLAIVGIGWLIYSSNQQQQRAQSLIPLSEVQLTNLRLMAGYSLYQLSGEVKNNSDHDLTDITLAVKAYDCPTKAINSSCAVVGEDDNVSTYIDVPAHQVRSLNGATYVNFDNMPKIRGNFLWSYKLTGTTGR